MIGFRQLILRHQTRINLFESDHAYSYLDFTLADSKGAKTHDQVHKSPDKIVVEVHEKQVIYHSGFYFLFTRDNFSVR